MRVRERVIRKAGVCNCTELSNWSSQNNLCERPPRLCAINAVYEQYRVPPNHVYLRINQQRPRGHHPWDRQHKRGEHNITRCHAQDFTTLPSRRFSSSISSSSSSLDSSVSASIPFSLFSSPFEYPPRRLYAAQAFSSRCYLFIASCNIRGTRYRFKKWTLGSFALANRTNCFRVLTDCFRGSAFSVREKIGLSRL